MRIFLDKICQFVLFGNIAPKNVLCVVLMGRLAVFALLLPGNDTFHAQYSAEIGNLFFLEPSARMLLAILHS